MAKSAKFFLLAFLVLPFLQITARAEEILKISEDIYVPPKDTKKSVLAIHGNVKVDGTVRDNAVAVMGHVVVGNAGIVQGSAIAIGGKVIKLTGGQIKGNEISIDPELKFLEKYFFLGVPLIGGLAAGIIGTTIVLGSLGFILLLAALLLLFPKQIERTRLVIWKEPLKSFILGILGFLVSIPIIIFFTITIIGFPIALALFGILVAAIFLGGISISLGIGAEISTRLHWELTPFWRGLLGIVILLIFSSLPFLGWLVKAVLLFFGLGGIIQTRFQS